MNEELLEERKFQLELAAYQSDSEKMITEYSTILAAFFALLVLINELDSGIVWLNLLIKGVVGVGFYILIKRHGSLIEETREKQRQLIIQKYINKYESKESQEHSE